MKDLFNSWRGVHLENNFLKFAVVGMLATNGVLGMTLLNSAPPIVLTPPNMSTAMEVAQNNADSEYKKSWGLFLAELLGNITPGQADFVGSAIEPFLAPEIYRQVRSAMSKQIDAIKLERITLQFTPRTVSYEVSTDTVFVTGRLISRGIGNSEETSARTYEFKINVRNYKPVVTFIDVYKGGVRTQKQKQAAEERAQKRKERES